jgi:hypothetical protein
MMEKTFIETDTQVYTHTCYQNMKVAELLQIA